MKCNTWISTTIGEQLVLQRGYDISKAEQVEGEVPVISSSGIKSFHNQSKVKGPGVLLGRKGTIGTVYYTESDYWPHSTTLYVKNFQNNNPRFVYYFFQSIKEQLKNMDVGTSNPTLNRNHVHPLNVMWPCVEIQNTIETVLSTLDAKIELNNKITSNLQQQAQAIFKSWFVDFEPFQNGEFVESELGVIPKGWTVKRADSIFDISIGKTPPRKEKEWFSLEKTDIKWVSISDMGKCGVYISDTSERLTHSAIEKHNIKIVPDNTVILSFKLTVGRVAITHGEMATNEAIAHFKTSDDILVPYLYCFLKNFNFQTLGSTSSIATAVNSKLIKQILILYPNELVIESFASTVFPLFNQIKVLEEENKKLSAIRDSLLPKLMSGELSVNEVQ